MQANAARGYQAYIDRVLGLMESGSAPWHKPWHGTVAPSNLASGKAYRGVNAFYLGIVAQQRGSPWFLTFRQAKARGGWIKAGSKGLPIVYWSRQAYTVNEEGEDVERVGLVSRVYHVFSVLDVEGITHLIPAPPTGPKGPPLRDAERLLLSVRPSPTVRHGGDKAYFSPDGDFVQMPEVRMFESTERYWATLFHELTHWTGHASRLNRSTLRDMRAFGDYEYSREELVAEMGSGLICATLGIENAVVEQSAAYLRSWARGIRDDPTALVWAAGRAQDAADFLLANWHREQAVEA